MAAATGQWVLILGASSGFGGAMAREFAQKGYHIAGVHLDRRATLPDAESVMADIRACGVEARFFNVNAADADKRAAVIAVLRGLLEERGELGQLRVLIHSLAFGALRPFTAVEGGAEIQPSHFAMTYEVMADSLVFWTQALLSNGLMGSGGRIYAMTSSGGHRVWAAYGAISAAKAALEAHVRQLAVELAPRAITVNAIQAGATDTPAVRRVPTHDELLTHALQINPHGRITTPIDVARAVVALSVPETAWITGNVIRVDGGEDIVA